MEHRPKEKIKNDPLTEKIIAACFKIHRALGAGFNEKIYRNALKIAIEDLGLKCNTEKNYVVKYENQHVGNLRIDLIIEDKVIVEIKAISGIMPKVFEHQILSYLKISGLRVGLLVNFGESRCQIKRFVY